MHSLKLFVVLLVCLPAGRALAESKSCSAPDVTKAVRKFLDSQPLTAEQNSADLNAWGDSSPSQKRAADAEDASLDN